MKASELYAGNYLNAADLKPGKKHSVHIFSVDVETVGQGAEQGPKLVLSLTAPGGRAWPKTLILNKTNMLVVSAAFGDETEHWPGKAIVVWSDPGVMYAGKRVGGIRVDAPSPQAGSGPAAPVPATPPLAQVAPGTPPSSGSQVSTTPAPGDGPLIDDEVPF